MNLAQFEISVNDGSRKAIESFKRNLMSANSVGAQLRNTLIAAFSVREVIAASDAYLNLRNRLTALYNSSELAEEGLKNVHRIAMESRADFEAVGHLYTRLALATEKYGISQDHIAAATQTVANTFVLAGAHASEAANSARQLAQGLASGALRGDELRSVMENNIILTNMLAEGLNMDVGALREFGKAGGITAEKVLPILVKNFQLTTEEIKKMPYTIGQAGTVFKSQFTVMIGKLGEATNAIKISSGFINTLTANMDALMIPVTALAVGGIPRLIAGIKALTIAIATNPFGLILTGAAAFLTFMYIFRQQIYDDLKPIFDITIPNAIDNALIAFERFKLILANLFPKRALTALKIGFNGILSIINKFIKKMPSLSKALGIDGEFELFDLNAAIIDEKKVDDKIKEIQERVANRVAKPSGYKVPSFLDILGIDMGTGAGEDVGELDLTRKFFENVKAGYADYVSTIKDTQDQIRDIFKRSFQELEDQLINFIKTGKASFRDFANSVIEQLMRIAIQQKIIRPLGEFFKLDMSTYEGGGYTGMGNRTGGIDGRGGFPAILHPNETVIDHTKGQSVGGAGGANVTFNINTIDASGFDELLASRKNMITAMINQAYNSRGKMGII